MFAARWAFASLTASLIARSNAGVSVQTPCSVMLTIELYLSLSSFGTFPGRLVCALCA